MRYLAASIAIAVGVAAGAFTLGLRRAKKVVAERPFVPSWVYRHDIDVDSYDPYLDKLYRDELQSRIPSHRQNNLPPL